LPGIEAALCQQAAQRRVGREECAALSQADEGGGRRPAPLWTRGQPAQHRDAHSLCVPAEADPPHAQRGRVVHQHGRLSHNPDIEQASRSFEMPSKIVDIHPHIVSQDTVRYPVTPLGGTRSEWSKERSVTLEALITAMDEAAVDKAAIVH